jgi:hypothetical protein
MVTTSGEMTAQATRHPETTAGAFEQPELDVEAFVAELERMGIKLTALQLADGSEPILDAAERRLGPSPKVG